MKGSPVVTARVKGPSAMEMTLPSPCRSIMPISRSSPNTPRSAVPSTSKSPVSVMENIAAKSSSASSLYTRSPRSILRSERMPEISRLEEPDVVPEDKSELSTYPLSASASTRLAVSVARMSVPRKPEMRSMASSTLALTLRGSMSAESSVMYRLPPAYSMPMYLTDESPPKSTAISPFAMLFARSSSTLAATDISSVSYVISKSMSLDVSRDTSDTMPFTLSPISSYSAFSAAVSAATVLSENASSRSISVPSMVI